MKRLLTMTLGVFALTFVTLAAHAQTPSAAAEVPDFGIVSGATYTNNYFRLTLTFPAGWTIQDAAEKKRISERGKQIVTTDDVAKKAELDRAADNTLNLLTVSERPIGSPGSLNSAFTCGAEMRPPAVETDADYMQAVKNVLKYSQAPVTVVRDVYPEEIGGVVFSAIDFKTDFSGVFIKQKYFAHIKKDYVLFFIITYDTPEQLQTNTGILKSVVLK